MLTDQLAPHTVPSRKVTKFLFETQLLRTSSAPPDPYIVVSRHGDQLVLQSSENVQLKRNIQLTKPVCAEKERDDGVETLATENDYAKIDDVQTSDTHNGNAQPGSANPTQEVSMSSEENEPQQADESRHLRVRA